MKDLSKYKSNDFYLSAVCMSAGCHLESLNRENRDFVEFVFKDSPDKCISIISKHWTGTLKVSSKKLIEAINQLKTRIHSNV